jgi:hypothetical protein
MRGVLLVLACSCATLAGCVGVMGEGSGEGGPVADGTEGLPFVVDVGQPMLLPFDTRVRRLAAALDRPMDDPIFDLMYRNRLRLGDYDHANGVLPDGLWLASRIRTWTECLLPVCGSSVMRSKFSALPEALPELIRAAWGRSATEEDLDAFGDELAQASVDADGAYQATCLAVFSAGEFVYR